MDELDRPDRELAALAAETFRRDPNQAAIVADVVESTHPLGETPIRRRAALARAVLLEPTRIAGELERGELETVEGWVLTRSEARLAIYLASLEAA